jgi:hypothetical protein
MFEYVKVILEKVSFDKWLFKKELSKSLKWITYTEAVLLHAWLVSTFGEKYSEIISETFKSYFKN